MPVGLPIDARPNLLPLGDPGLSWPEFETFCRAYVSARPEVRRVEAYAKHGEPQDGVDLIAFLHDDRTRTYQCRKRKHFSGSDAVATMAATTRPADEHEIFISCEAGKPVRDAVHPATGWEVSDIKDLSLAVRELDREKARNVVEDAFGVPWRRAFLGPTDALVFVDPARYFRPFERPGALFRHTWELVGRTKTLETLVAAAAAEQVRAVVVVGRGGVGKTRLLRALSDRLSRVLFALDGQEIDAAAVDALPFAQATIVVDDVHRRIGDVGPLLEEAARRDRDQLTLVLATRPNRLDELRGSLTRAGLHDDAVVVLSPLPELEADEVTALAEQALGKQHAGLAPAVAAATADCPLVTVVGGQLVAQRKLAPELFERDEDFRYAVLERWREEMLGELSTDLSPAVAATVLRLVAALAPLSLDDQPTLQAAAGEADLGLVELRHALSELLDAGLLVAYGRLVRILPDVLSDHVLHRACLDRQENPTGYAEELFERFGTMALPALLRNLAELDWRISATSGASALLDAVWDRLIRDFIARDAALRVELLHRLRPAAMLQPARIFELARAASAHPAQPSALAAAFDVHFGDAWVQEELAELVRRAGTDPSHVAEALSALWPIARDQPDRRSVMGATDPVRAIQDLGDVASGGLYAAEALVSFVDRLLSGPDAAAPLCPLVLLEQLLAREGTNLVREGLGFLPTHYTLPADAVGPLRRRIFSLLERQARNGTPRNRAVAARLLGEALDQPRGAFGQPTPRAAFDQWLPEQLHLFDILAGLMSETAALVRSRLRTATAWHADHGAWPEARDAARLVLATTEDEDESFSTALVHPFDFHRDEVVDRQRLYTVAERLIAERREVPLLIDEALEEAGLAGANPNPRPLLATIAAQSAALGQKLAEACIANPGRPLAEYLDGLLATLARAAPERVGEVLATIDHGSVTLRKAVAGLLGDIDWQEHEVGRLDALATLVRDADLGVRRTAMNAVVRARGHHPARAVDLALKADIGHDPHMASLMCITLHDADVTLGREQLEGALRVLRDVDELEHSVVQFLCQAGEYHPRMVLALLVDRLGPAPRPQLLRANPVASVRLRHPRRRGRRRVRRAAAQCPGDRAERGPDGPAPCTAAVLAP